MKLFPLSCVVALAAAVPVELLTELAQTGAGSTQSGSMQTLLPGQVEEAVAEMNEHVEIQEAEEKTPAMEEYEHLTEKEPSSSPVVAQGDDPPEEPKTMEVVLEDDDTEDSQSE